MTVILDTAAMAVEDRLEATYEAFALTPVPMSVSFRRPTETLARAEAWTLGPISVLHVRARDLQLERTRRQAKSGSCGLVAGGFLLHGAGRWRIGERWGSTDQVNLIDLAEPSALWWAGEAVACAFEIPEEQLGLPPRIVERAQAQLTSSPLYPVVAGHLRRFVSDIDAIVAEPGGPAVATATVQMLRALIASASGEEQEACQSTAESLWPLITAYIDAHLTECDLSPARIARANNISLRYLYKLSASHDIRIAEWIIERRLQGARAELEGPSSRSVATVARRWGFTDPAHFSERFRRAFGLSPRQWRVAAPRPADACRREASPDRWRR